MMDIDETIPGLVRDGFILVSHPDRPPDIVKTAQALPDAGSGNMQVAFRTQKPLGQIRRLGNALPGFCIGAASGKLSRL